MSLKQYPLLAKHYTNKANTSTTPIAHACYCKFGMLTLTDFDFFGLVVFDLLWFKCIQGQCSIIRILIAKYMSFLSLPYEIGRKKYSLDK